VAPNEHDEGRSPWTRPAFILSGAFVVVAVLLGLWLVASSGPGHRPGRGKAAAPTSTGATSRTRPGAAPSSVPTTTPRATASGCHLPAGSQDVLTVAPAGITWQLWQGIALPYSKTAGPGVVQGDVARCYAHSPLGALLAAVQISYRFVASNSNDWQSIVYQQLMPGPGRNVVISTEKAAAKQPNPPSSTGTYSQVAGFSFVTYTSEVAVIDLVARSDNGVMQVGTFTVQWSSGDWKLAVQPDGSFTPPVQPVSSIVGYVEWGGV
jgi:hypothetical protein